MGRFVTIAHNMSALRSFEGRGCHLGTWEVDSLLSLREKSSNLTQLTHRPPSVVPPSMLKVEIVTNDKTQDATLAFVQILAIIVVIHERPQRLTFREDSLGKQNGS